MDTLESLRRKIKGAEDLKSVVRAMKAVSSSNIVQYKQAVNALGDYYRTIALGIIAYFKSEHMHVINYSTFEKKSNSEESAVCAIVFGSDQGLVGQFNDSLTDFVLRSLKALPGKKEIWAVGERIQLLLSDVGFNATKLFLVPNSVNAITPLIGEILIESQENLESGKLKKFYIFHNQPRSASGYDPKQQQLLPLDEKWKLAIDEHTWPTNKLPDVAGDRKLTLLALIHEYLFVSLFRACAESLASENASRLEAMERANKNIDELLDTLSQTFHQTRQSSIDEELFDVVSGFEALKGS